MDPDNAGAYVHEPQSWNGYSYGRNNPLLFVDPDGRDVEVNWGGGSRITYLDSEFARLKKDLQKQGFIVQNGNIYARVYDDDGNVIGRRRIGTYVSDCLNCEQFVREMSRRAEPLQTVVTVGAVASAVVIAAPIVALEVSTGGVTTLGLGGGAAANTPSYVRRVLNHIKSSNGSAPPGYRGGRTFKNDARGGGQSLPRTDANGRQITYREYDVHPHQQGVNRGAERIVRGSDGSTYYTNDHYKTFTKIE